MKENENWKPVPSYKGIYEVSDEGQVRSIPRIDSMGRPKEYKILKQQLNRYGYFCVSLYKHGKTENKTVHRLVASVYLSDYSELIQVDHRDGDRSNSSLYNLRMSTQTYNNANARKLKKTSSKYKGVFWHRRDKKWISRINKDGKSYKCGRYDSEKKAAEAYDKKSIELYGDFGMTNKRLGLYEQEKNNKRWVE